MTIQPKSIAVKRALALLTILAIAGTLSACGRYGRPVRPKASLVTSTFASSDSAAHGPKQGEKAQTARIEKPIRNDLRTSADLASSVFRSPVR